MVKLGWLLCLVANAACLQTTSFHCTKSSQCMTPSQTGTCESVGYCSFPDSSCPDGKRFGDLAGDSLSNTCVGSQQPGIDAAPVFVTIGGTVTGLTGTGLVLHDNTADPLAITANGMFTFATKLAQGTGYSVSVATPPSGQDAYVGHASGTANGPVTSVVVSCFAAGSDPGILCDTGIFCGGSEQCCFDANSGSGTCGPIVGGFCTKIAMPCDSSHECSGGTGVCCAKFHNGASGLQQISCVGAAAQCTAGGGVTTEILCDSRDATPCPSGTSCTGTSMLGSAYHTCQ